MPTRPAVRAEPDTTDLTADVAVVGAGAAGLALADALARRGAGERVALLETPRADLRSPERTWCSWQDPASPALAGSVGAVWPHADVVGPGGARQRLDLPVPYVLVRSGDHARAVGARLAAAGARRLAVTVTGLRDSPDEPRAVVRGHDAEGRPVRVRARWVVDTRPPRLPPEVPPGRTRLLQHFRGWFVRTREDAFDPAAAVLMDFRPPQPPGEVAFGYVLPTSPREALVEYTGFSAAPLDGAGYDAALRAYAATAGLPPFDVVAVEQGVVPMTDEPLPRVVGPRTVRLGTAGGATRPSTGYTFAAALRQAEAVAGALVAGRPPVPPRAYRRRHLAMDSLLLRALVTGRVEGAAFLADLFARHPAERVVRFLDGATSPWEDLALMRTAPRGPMLATVAERALPRGLRRQPRG
ncbi:lycopene cyclase family protein [Vallicoccus soli]|uniref:lycopene cyclase family protein n=1 Tax=Vallicoccus soli TaxID=2339232 RepID=UPI001C49AFC8|nr:lycopene cyclase family protein [Vallicoccus soli]